jgi:hypothetical protein
MRQLIIGFLCTAALLATTCNRNPAPDAVNAAGNAAGDSGDYFTVRAGPVANDKIAALSGNFQMLKVSAAHGIPSDGRGGACLIFPAADLGFTEMAKIVCHSNKHCSPYAPAPPDATGPDKGSYLPPSDPTHRENRYGYCEQSSNVCWSKPIAPAGGPPVEPPFCNRPIQMAPNTLNPVPNTPVDAGLYGVKPGAKVRVVACLNKGTPPYPPPGAPCGQVDSADRIEVMGPVATVKP